MSSRPSVLRELDAIYAELPTIECKGLCGKTNCGPVHGCKVEDRNIREATGKPLQFPMVSINALDCPHLTKENRCSIYEVRPLICRLFGMVQVRPMICPHGCKPSRWMSHAEANDFMKRVFDLKK